MIKNNESLDSKKVKSPAEKQLSELEKAQNEKIREMKAKRKSLLELKNTLSTLIYAASRGFKSVYPDAEGFIEGRVKSPDSIETKTKNKITEILSQIEEDPNINQKEILKKISNIDFKDFFALSVVTTKPPKRFKTGSDIDNKELTALSSEISKSENRMTEHENFINFYKDETSKLTGELSDLRAKESETMSKEEIEKAIKQKEDEIVSLRTTVSEEQFRQLLKEHADLINSVEKEKIQQKILEKSNRLNQAKGNIKYGKGNLERTMKILHSSVRDLQYKMSKYYVSNLAKFSIFKFWGTTTEKSKEVIKPSFRAFNGAYKVKFTNDDGKQNVILFEVQGKGELDYLDAEFSAEGAEYHEDQKTKDGIISKNIVMPNFNIIDEDLAEKIEKDVETKYSDILSIEDLEEYGIEPETVTIDEIKQELKNYEEKLYAENEEKKIPKIISKKQIKRKISKEFENMKTHFIQDEIDKKIDDEIYKLVDNKSYFCKRIAENKKESLKIYEQELLKIRDKNPDLSDDELVREAKKSVLYRLKEKEIAKIAETSIPKFFRANLPKSDEEPIQIYWFTTGETIYRFFRNRFNGLKRADGNYQYEPEEQKKRALLKLTGLFEEDPDNFYTYDMKSDTFGTINGDVRTEDR